MADFAEYSNASAWRLPDLEAWVASRVLNFQRQHADFWNQNGIFEPTEPEDFHGRRQVAREAMTLCFLEKAASGIFYDAQPTQVGLGGPMNAMIHKTKPELFLECASFGLHPSELDPGALAWLWSELDSREKNVASGLDGQMLCHWLWGSFEHPETPWNSDLSAGQKIPVAAHDWARSFGSQGVEIRRAMRAQALGDMLVGGRWKDSAKAMAAMGKAAWHGDGEARGLFQAAKSIHFSLGRSERAAALELAGVAAIGLSAFASSLVAVVAVWASGVAALCLGAAASAAASRHPMDGPRSASWHRGICAMVNQCYPNFRDHGVFEAWMAVVPGDGKGAYEGLARATGIDAAILATATRHFMAPPLPLGGAGFDSSRLFEAVRSLMDSNALAASVPAQGTRPPRSWL